MNLDCERDERMCNKYVVQLLYNSYKASLTQDTWKLNLDVRIYISYKHESRNARVRELFVERILLYAPFKKIFFDLLVNSYNFQKLLTNPFTKILRRYTDTITTSSNLMTLYRWSYFCLFGVVITIDEILLKTQP